MSFEGTAEYVYEQSFWGVDKKWARENYYNNGDGSKLNIGKNLKAFAVTGEALGSIRGVQKTDVTYLDSYGGFRDPLDLHSQALLVNLMFVHKNKDQYKGWHYVGKYLIDSLFSKEVAEFAKVDEDGIATIEAKMMSMFAYTTLSGEEGLVYGNTAIRTLFKDAQELGKVLRKFGLDTFTSDNAKYITDIIVQFAAVLANNKDEEHNKQGVLNLQKDDKGFVLDLSKELWQDFEKNPDEIIHQKKFITSYFAAHSLTPSKVNEIVKDVWGGELDLVSFDNILNRFHVDGSEDLRKIALTNRSKAVDGDNNVDVYISNGKNNEITDTNGSDLIFAGAGDDTFIVQSGKNALIGG